MRTVLSGRGVDRFNGLDTVITAAGLLRRGDFVEMAEDQIALIAMVNYEMRFVIDANFCKAPA
ncbi:MAG: hypothetical protein ABI150_03705 [Nitrobacter sp.]